MIGIAVAFEGRLGQDAEGRFLANGSPMISFTCAVDVGRFYSRSGWACRKHWG